MKKFVLVPIVETYNGIYVGKNISEILETIVDKSLWTFEKNFENAKGHGLNTVCKMTYDPYEGIIELETEEDVNIDMVDILCDLIDVFYDVIETTVRLKLY